MEGKSFVGTMIWGVAAGFGLHIGWAIVTLVGTLIARLGH